MKLTVVTCTGGRPELFALCRKWVLRQTWQPDRWLVTYDTGDAPHAPEADVVAIPKSYPPPSEGHSWANRALLFALSQVEPGHDVVVMEDDDWYGRRYIEDVLGAARASDFGVAQQRCYRMFHLPSRRYAECRTDGEHPGPVEGLLVFTARRHADVQTWVAQLNRPVLGSVAVDTDQIAQIKGVGFGLPGRTGATRKHITGHRKLRGMLADSDFSLFRSTLGADDAASYLELLR